MSLSKKELTLWLKSKISTFGDLEADAVDCDLPFAELHVNSLDAVSITGELEEILDREIDPTTLYEFTTINQLVSHLTLELGD